MDRLLIPSYWRAWFSVAADAPRVHPLDEGLVSIKDLVLSWPVVRQLATGGDGTGPEAMTAQTVDLRPRNDGAGAARSVCPYCAVGCGQLIFHRHGRVVSVEGDPGSPISEGHLCPKGAATFELLTHAARLTRVKYRAPYATAWTELDLDTAMEMVAARVWASRARHFEETRDTAAGTAPLMQCPSIAHLGGATLDNEENYVIKKLFTGGLGMVALSNQARI
jgi:formate dehydrogenase major subunit